MSRTAIPLDLDVASGRPVKREVQRKMDAAMHLRLGNPHAVHAKGRAALAILDRARMQIAECFGVHALDVILTSGATESNNLILQGTARYWQKRRKPVHFIISAIEHASLMEAARLLEERGCQISVLPVNEDGIVQWERLYELVRPQTRLISIMAVNHETGAIQPLKKVRDGLERLHAERKEKTLDRIVFHSDAVQALETLPCDLTSLGVDALSFSAHKIGGPQGIGGLIRRRGTVPLLAIAGGGDQESGLRPGTVAVPLAVGCAAALMERHHPRSLARENQKRDRFLQVLKKTFPSLRVHGPLGSDQVPWMVNVFIPDCDGEALLLSLDRKGYCCSAGSACLVGARTPSHVLRAMGFSAVEARSSLRISWSSETPFSTLLKFSQEVAREGHRIMGMARHR